MCEYNNDAFIAHIRSSDQCIQTVQEHNQGVAALARIAGAEYEIENLSECAGAHHDDGKKTPEFRQYIMDAMDGVKRPKGSVIHSTHGACLIDKFRDDTKPASKLAAEMIRTAIISHHGIRDAVSPDGKVCFYIAKDNISNTYDQFEKYFYSKILKTDVEEAFERAENDAQKILQKIKSINPKQNKLGSAHIYLALYQRLLTSILIDADRTDTACFEDNVSPPKRLNRQELMAQWHRYRTYCDQAIEQMTKSKTSSPLDQYRSEISDACANFDGGSGGIFRLIVPCGAGKTLSSLRFALQTAERYGKNRIFYIAPFNSILDQNADEIGKFIGDDNAVLRHHSNVIMEESEAESDGEMERKYKLLTENWLHSPIIATSAVQFLNTLFISKTSAVRRMQALGNSVIIIDEIQALPIKVLKLFNSAINFLASFCNVSVLLCSATQPLLDEIQSYRLITPRNIAGDIDKYTEAFRRVKIEDCSQGNGKTFAEAADFIFEKAQSANSVLAIVNTKNAAKQIAMRIQKLIPDSEEYELFHLSTNMCPAHRNSVIQKLKAALQRKGRKAKVICVSTTLIEAGVDVSFEVVVRSLTGFDSIVQAAGRCNRNRETDYGVVSIIYINEERVEKIENLQSAQQITREIFYSVKKRPLEYAGGFLSKKAMDQYYEKFYRGIEEKMGYPLKDDKEHTIVDLLTNKNPGIRKNHEAGSLCLTQAFKKAGSEFEVIDDSGKSDVIVEYSDDAKSHIAKLRACKTIAERKKEICYLQRYTLQLNLNPKSLGESGVYQDSNLGIYFLSDRYYDAVFGMIDEDVFLCY